MDDFLYLLPLCILIGGSMGYAIIYELGSLVDNPLSFFQLYTNARTSYHSSLIGVLVGATFFARKREIPIRTVLDLLALALPVYLAAQDVAAYLDGWGFGREFASPFGVTQCGTDGLPHRYHASQLYEAVLCGALFFLLRFLERRWDLLRFPGLTTGVFVIGFTISRLAIEVWTRIPDPHLAQSGAIWIFRGVTFVPLIALGAGLVVSSNLIGPSQGNRRR